MKEEEREEVLEKFVDYLHNKFDHIGLETYVGGGDYSRACIYGELYKYIANTRED